jgi:hypothetical protein
VRAVSQRASRSTEPAGEELPPSGSQAADRAKRRWTRDICRHYVVTQSGGGGLDSGEEGDLRAYGQRGPACYPSRFGERAHPDAVGGLPASMLRSWMTRALARSVAGESLCPGPSQSES